MKLAVHWAPLVNSCTPGWMVAVDADAQVGVAPAVVAGIRTETGRTSPARIAMRRRTFFSVGVVMTTIFSLFRRAPFPTLPVPRHDGGRGPDRGDRVTLGV